MPTCVFKEVEQIYDVDYKGNMSKFPTTAFDQLTEWNGWIHVK